MDSSAEPRIPGFEGWVSDLRQRMDADAGGDDALPLEWTPEHVGARLVEAFETLRRAGSRSGPKQFGNGWPTMLREFSDLVDADAQKNHAAAATADRSPPSSEEVSRMNEALRWPMDHLGGKALASDSLMLWAYCRAHDVDISRVLHLRKKRASALAGEMARRINRLPYGGGEHGAGDCRSMADQWRAALRQQVAREVLLVVASKEARLLPGDREGAAKVQADGMVLMRERCAALNCLPARFKPHEAMPGRALARTTLDRHRKIAMAAVADGLRRSGVAVR